MRRRSDFQSNRRDDKKAVPRQGLWRGDQLLHPITLLSPQDIPAQGGNVTRLSLVAFIRIERCVFL